jgi:peptidoglycan/LPS O-acetylase OafA/YrhL
MIVTLGKSVWDDTLLAFGTCLVMCATTLRGAKGRPWTAAVRWFGRHSYEVYLSHQFVVLTGTRLFAHYHKHGATRSMVAGCVLAIVLATAPLGWALARWFSEPMNRWLRGARMAK